MTSGSYPSPPGAGGTPSAEVDVSVGLVHELLAQQHPDLADLPLTVVANGWDNVIRRVGDDLVARLPRRRLAAGLVAGEQRWLPSLATRLPIPIAAPVRTGRPGLGYPWAWSICRWFDGEVAADARPADPGREADRLGGFVHALHRLAPADAPANPFRGQPVAELAPRIRGNLGSLFASPTPSTSSGTYSAILALIDQLATTPEWTGPPLWLHGDLHTANIVMADGAIAAVIDFGDLTSGDPAVDLAVAWMLFAGDDRARFRVAAGGGTAVDDHTWARARLWGLHFALIYLLHSADNERFGRMGRGLLDAVLHRE